jgi:cysteine desulfurase
MQVREADAKRIQALRDRLDAGLGDSGPATIIARVEPRLPNTTLFVAPGVKAETAVIGFDLGGIAVSSGSACSSGKVRPSHVLEAMGLGPEIAQSGVRLSLGWSTSEADIDRCLQAWRKLSATLTKGSDETRLERF